MNPLESHYEFMRTLPRTPLANHIGQIDVVLVYLLNGNDPYSVQAARHSLREIARACPVTPYHELRPERLSEGTHDLAGVMDMRIDPAFDPQAMKRAITAAFSGVRAALSKMTKQPVDGLNERVALRKYRATIAAEREIGLAFVRQEAARVRKELGL